MACSSPNRHCRVAPVGSPAWPASRWSWSPSRPSGRSAKICRGPLQVPLPLQFPLDLAQRVHVVHGLAAEGAADRVLVDVVEAGAGVVLAQRRRQVRQVGQVRDRRGGVAEPERLLPGHRLLLPAGHVEVRAAGAQRAGQPGHLRGQAGVGQRLVHQAGQLVPLLGGQRGQQPLGRHGPAGQLVDQLLQVGRAVGEQVPVARHEGVEVLLSVLAPGVGVQHRVQVGQHVLDPLQRLRVRVGQRVLHAAELAVQYLPPEQVLELLEGLPRGVRAPLVAGQPADRLRGVRGQRVKFGLAHPGVVAGVGEQLGPLLPDRGVQQGPGLLQDAVQAAAAADLLALLPDPPQHVVQAAVALHAAAEQVAQRAARVGAAEHRLAHLVERAPRVVGRRERVRSAGVRAVPVTSHVILLRAGRISREPPARSGTPPRRPPRPWTGGASGRALRARTPPPRPRARVTRCLPCRAVA